MKWIETQINGSVVRIAFDADSIHIFDAYPIKDDLKREGFRWNPDDKSWFLKDRDPQAVLTRLSAGGSVSADLNMSAELSKTIETESPDEAATGISIGQLRERIENLLARHLPASLWVRGVIVSEIKSYRWASYFDLGEEDGASPFFFRVELPSERLGHIEKALAELGVASRLEKDLPVLFKVSLSLSQRYVVDVRLSVLDILAEYTQSKLRNQREITLERLKKEGVADRQRQLTLPMHFERIGLISSSQGTSIEDIRSAMAPHLSRYHLLFCDARMEGALAVSSVVSAIRRFTQMADPPELIVLARGGGSEQSLAVFNDYRICREICLAPIPVLAAIGHEKDLSAAELCAHIVPTPSTPSGAGKFLAQRFEQLLESLKGLVGVWLVFGRRAVDGEERTLKARLRYLPQILSARFASAQDQLARRLRSSSVDRLRDRIEEGEKDVRIELERLFYSGRRVFGLAGERLKNQSDMIAAYSPERVLKRGFTLLFDRNGRVMKEKKELLSHRKGTLRFQDGDIAIQTGDTGE